jgi:hypothetical protein
MAQAQFPVGIIEKPPGTGAVVSVEQIFITIPANTASATVAATKNQNAVQSVPLNVMCRYGTTVAASQALYSDNSNIGVDVFDDAGTCKVTASRYSSTTAAEIIVLVQLVEWIPAIRVQKIAHNAGVNQKLTTWTRTIPTAIDQSKTFPVLSHRDAEFGSIVGAEGSLRVTFDNTTTIRFNRGDVGFGQDAVTGYVWLVEDTSSSNAYFSVRTENFSTTSTNTTKTITAVDQLNKTLLIPTYQVGGTATQAAYNVWEISLETTTAIRFKKGNTNYTLQGEIYLVEFKNKTTIQRGVKTVTSPATNTVETFTISITSVEEAASAVVVMDSMQYLKFRPATNYSSNSYMENRANIEIDSGGTGLTGRYRSYSTAYTHYIAWQLVEFDVT